MAIKPLTGNTPIAPGSASELSCYEVMMEFYLAATDVNNYDCSLNSAHSERAFQKALHDAYYTLWWRTVKEESREKIKELTSKIEDLTASREIELAKISRLKPLLLRCAKTDPQIIPSIATTFERSTLVTATEYYLRILLSG